MFFSLMAYALVQLAEQSTHHVSRRWVKGKLTGLWEETLPAG